MSINRTITAAQAVIKATEAVSEFEKAANAYLGLVKTAAQVGATPGVGAPSQPGSPLGTAAPVPPGSKMGQYAQQMLGSLVGTMGAMKKAVDAIMPVMQQQQQLHKQVVQQFTRMKFIFTNLEKNPQVQKGIGRALGTWWSSFSQNIDFQKAKPQEVSQKIGEYMAKLQQMTGNVANFSNAKAMGTAAKGITHNDAPSPADAAAVRQSVGVNKPVGPQNRGVPQTPPNAFGVQEQKNQATPVPPINPQQKPGFLQRMKNRFTGAEANGQFVKTASGDEWGWSLLDAEDANLFAAHQAASEYINGLVKMAANGDIVDKNEQFNAALNTNRGPGTGKRRLQERPFHPDQTKVRHLHEEGKPGENPAGFDRETGYSAQAYAASEIFTGVQALKKKLVGMATETRAAMKKVLETIQSASESFEDSVGHDMLGETLRKLQSTFPSDLKNLGAMYQWCMTVESAMAPSMKKLNRDKTPDAQGDTLADMHKGFKPKDQPPQAGPTILPDTTPAQPAAPLEYKNNLFASDKKGVKTANDGNWGWKLQ